MRLLLIGMGVGGALLLAEAVAKVIDVRAQQRYLHTAGRISRTSDIPGVRYELIPGVRALTPHAQIEIRVNNIGFRGPDIDKSKPAGVLRVAVLGDSIGFGRTYEEEQIFPTIAQSLLRQQYAQHPIEVINACLSGRDTWEEAAVLEHSVLGLEPDVVVLQICLNDHIRLPPPPSHAAWGMFGDHAWYEYSSLLKLLDERLPGFRRHHVTWLQRLNLDSRTEKQVLIDQNISPKQMLEYGPHWEDWSDVLRRIVDLSRSHGAQVVFMVFPIDYQLKRGDTETLPGLTALAKEFGVPLIDMTEEYGSRWVGMLRDYTHPSPAGHTVAAEALARAILPHLENAAPVQQVDSTVRDPAFAGSKL